MINECIVRVFANSQMQMARREESHFNCKFARIPYIGENIRPNPDVPGSEVGRVVDVFHYCLHLDEDYVGAIGIAAEIHIVKRI